MASATRPRVKRKVALYILGFFLLILAFLLLFVNRFLEPVLRDRLHTLIIDGSDSLYAYKLGNLDANFYGGNVEVENLQITIDSARYKQLSQQHALPSLTLQLNLVKGHIKGIGIIPLLFSKEIRIDEILSQDADIRLLRHIRKDDAPQNTLPLWKALQPAINSIAIDRIKLDGVKMLYRNADTSEAVKLQFDRCVALFDDIRIDSASSVDTARIGFTKNITMRFDDLKFRTPDSSYKMKAEIIQYSSANRTFEINDFKLQPTREDTASFYAFTGRARAMNVITFEKVKFTNFRLDRFFHNNVILADSVFIHKPNVSIYVDKTKPSVFESKIGRYPHQNLLKAASTIIVKGLVVRGFDLTYREKAQKTAQEGKFTLNDINILATNVTNDSNIIKQNNICTATAQGHILGNSPLNVRFTFFLGSANGQFEASGTVKNVTAPQLNALAEPMANVRMQSFNMRQLSFSIRGDDFSAGGSVRMLYDNLFVVLRKTDDETGEKSTKKFLTKILNKFTLHHSNPGPDGRERMGDNIRRSRLSTQPFFGLLWKTIFAGMQNVMMQTGRYE